MKRRILVPAVLLEDDKSNVRYAKQKSEKPGKVRRNLAKKLPGTWPGTGTIEVKCIRYAGTSIPGTR